MKHGLVLLIGLLLVSCAEPQAVEVEVTREVEVPHDVIVEVPYEVTRVVPATPIVDQQILAADEDGLGVQFTDGVWLVGVQIARGLYVNTGGVVITQADGSLDFECGWKVGTRLSTGYGGGSTRLYDYGSFHNLVEIIGGDRVFESFGCGVWTRQS